MFILKNRCYSILFFSRTQSSFSRLSLPSLLERSQNFLVPGLFRRRQQLVLWGCYLIFEILHLCLTQLKHFRIIAWANRFQLQPVSTSWAAIGSCAIVRLDKDLDSSFKGIHRLNTVTYRWEGTGCYNQCRDRCVAGLGVCAWSSTSNPSYTGWVEVWLR